MVITAPDVVKRIEIAEVPGLAPWKEHAILSRDGGLEVRSAWLCNHWYCTEYNKAMLKDQRASVSVITKCNFRFSCQVYILLLSHIRVVLIILIVPSPSIFRTQCVLYLLFIQPEPQPQWPPSFPAFG